jgi:hypothetical protein
MPRNFRNYLNEASILKPDYVEGHKFAWNGKGVKEFETAGYKRNNIFTVVTGSEGAVLIGSQDAENEKYLQGPDGKVWHFKGGLSFKASSFTHVKESGGTPSGAEWENLIVFAYNNLKGTATDEETKEVALKYWERYGNISDEIAKNFDTNLKAKQLVQTGRGLGNVKLGKFWKAAGATNKTPKTDIASSNFVEKISLKKGGGSQLISAEKKEALAIVNAALYEMGGNAPFAKKLTKAIEDKMTRLVTTEAVTTLQKRSMMGDKDAGVIDYQKKDNDHKELSAMLKEAIRGASESNNLFARHIVLEAATGNNKFGGANSKAAANVLGKFDIRTFEVVVQPISSIDDPIIIEYAQKVRPYVAFKKGSAGSAAYSAMRMGLSEGYTFQKLVTEELSNIQGFYLTEDILNEGPMGMLRRAGTFAKRAGAAAKKALDAAVKKIILKLKKVFVAIAKKGKNMMAALMKFLGVEVSTASGIPAEVGL